MYEITTVEQIDEARFIDAGTMREAIEAFVTEAVDNGYWDDISEDNTAALMARSEGKVWKYMNVTLDPRTSITIISVLP